ncbi:hypothetical protein D3C78_1970590 [compost metagenome]
MMGVAVGVKQDGLDERARAGIVKRLPTWAECSKRYHHLVCLHFSRNEPAEHLLMVHSQED